MSKSGRLSVLILIDSLTCGGAEKSLVSLLPHLVGRGYDITLMLRARGGMFERFVPQEVRLLTFPAPPGGPGGLMARMLFSLRLRLPHNRRVHGAELHWATVGHRYASLPEEFDVAIAYQQGFPTFFIAEKVKARKKICWANVDLLKASYSPEFCRPFYARYDHVVAVSTILADKIHADGFVPARDRITTVYDILDSSLIRSLADSGEPFESGDGKIRIATVGRLMPQKGYDLAIGAARILAGKGVGFKWHIVGGGMLESTLRQMIDDASLQGKVILEGEKLNPYPYIKNCDIYVSTSRFEGFGLTIGEAKILHKPIVSTNFPVIHNQITNEVNGLIAGMTPESIAAAVMRLIGDPSLRRAFVVRLMEERNTTPETESAKVRSLIEQQ